MTSNRIKFYDSAVSYLFIIGLISDIINTFLFNNYIPSIFLEYFFWLSLGLYGGFNLCKWEVKKILKQ